MISQHEHFSVNHFLSAGGIHCITGKRRVSMHKEDCHCIGEAGGRSNGTYSNKSTLSLWPSPSEAALRQEGGKRALSEESSFRGLLVSFMTKRAPRKSSSLWEFTQAFEDGGRIIPNTFLYVSSQGEGISSSTRNLVFGTCQSLESIAVNFPRERSSYKWRKQHFFGVAVEFQAAKYPFSLTSLPVRPHCWGFSDIWASTSLSRNNFSLPNWRGIALPLFPYLISIWSISRKLLWIWSSATKETDYGRGKLLDGPYICHCCPS